MMIERKNKTKQPCVRCGMAPLRCFCELIPVLETRTQLLLVIHAKELKRTSNSGTLALQCLANSVMKVRGEGTESLDLSPFLQGGYTNLLLYPSEDAIELTAEFIAQLDRQPVRLIVPDGNWRQASKVPSRHPELSRIQKVMIKKINQASHHLRKETSPYGMSTLEAIAEALGILESQSVGAKLREVYQLKLEKTLEGRKGRMMSALQSET